MSDFDDRWSFADVDTTQHFIDNMYYTAKASRHGNAADVSWMGTGANSGSAAYLAKKRNDGVSLSKDGLNKLSQTRQSYMVEMAERARLEMGGRPDLGLAATVSPRANLVKTASLAAAPAGRLASTENTTHLGPEIYSPLFLTQNLQLPRDRITANAWNRAFYETNPIVRNAINLHATYPISKLNIKCEDKNVEKFFNDMAEKIDLQTVVQNVALEYWALGEAFPYAALDEATGMWDQIYIHNPDYIRVKASPIPTKAPIISLKPDPELQKLVTSSDPEHIRLREQIDPKIINHVIRGEMIPLDSFSISHLKYLKSPYDVRGTSIINGVWKMLMAMDKIFENKFVQLDGMINPLTLVHLGASGSDGHYPRQDEIDAWRAILECHDDQTEVLTDQGFKRFEEVINYTEIVKDGLSIITDVRPVPGIRIACFNRYTEELEYHEPTKAFVNNYDGVMHHFHNKKIDIKVTPNHKMWVSKKRYAVVDGKPHQAYWDDWKIVEAGQLEMTEYHRFRSCAKWVGGDIESVSICDKAVPINLYLEFMGYLLSEGCLYTNNKNSWTVGICQSVSKFKDQMDDCCARLADVLGRTYGSTIRSRRVDHADMWNGIFSGKDLYSFFKEQVQDESGRVKSHFKRIPRWVLQLPSERLEILLAAMVAGDGSIYSSPKSNFKRYVYYTTSKGLADDVYEAAYKCGYTPTLAIRNDGRPNRLPIYEVSWSDSGKGDFPLIWKTTRNSQTREAYETISLEKYKGKVWCFQVPTGLFVTRRNGKITIQHNSAQFDKDFKIVTHDAVKIEKVGNSGSIVDTGNDLNMIIDLILMGLMIPKSVLTQEGSSYASASVALDVMRQRYNNFRVMMANWLEKKIFAPISEINQFYKLEAKKKRLIVPTIEWNHMTLYDLDNYIAQVSGLVEKRRVSQQTLDRSLGLNRHNEIVNIREEMIQEAIAAKEAEALSHMTLAQLRALDPEEEIITHEGPPLPGARVPGMGGAGLDMGMGAGGPGLGGDMFGGGLGGGLGGGMGGGFGPPMPGPDLGMPGGMGAAGPDLGAAPGAGQPPTPPPL